MEPIRILHTHEPGYGWYFSSPDLPGLTGGDITYAAAHRRAEEAVTFALEARVDGNGTPVSVDLPVVHFVTERDAPAVA